MKGIRTCLHCQFENPNPHRAICERCAKCHCQRQGWWMCGDGKVTRKREIRKFYSYKVKNILEAER